MTLEECYRALGGSYSEVLARLIDDKMITKYLNKFTEDTSKTPENRKLPLHKITLPYKHVGQSW